MGRQKAPPWTQEERLILEDVYPREGINGAADALPHRSWQAIQQMAHKMGVRSPVVIDAPKPKLQGEQLAEAVRLREADRWSFARIGATFGVSEAAACNAVMIALCEKSGHRPARRDEHGRLHPDEFERLRLMLRKGLKGVDIQLRMGISASRIAEERRRYNRELKERGKAALPPPGEGKAYCGVKLPKAKRAEVEALYMQGLGAQKVCEQTGVSRTSCLRIRARLVKRLARKGECLPGCDRRGVRHAASQSTRYIPAEAIEALRRKILAGEPVIRAAKMLGIGGSSAYRIRDALKAELEARGESLPAPIRLGRVPAGSRETAWLPPELMTHHRALIAKIGLEAATAQVKAELAEARRAERERKKSFDEQLAEVRAGAARIVPVFVPSKALPAGTLGGVASGQLA